MCAGRRGTLNQDELHVVVLLKLKIAPSVVYIQQKNKVVVTVVHSKWTYFTQYISHCWPL